MDSKVSLQIIHPKYPRFRLAFQLLKLSISTKLLIDTLYEIITPQCMSIFNCRHPFKPHQFHTTLQWCHMRVMASEIGGGSSVSSTCSLCITTKKTSKPRITGFCDGNLPVTGRFPTQRASHAVGVSMLWRLNGKSRYRLWRLITSGCLRWSSHACVLQRMRVRLHFLKILRIIKRSFGCGCKARRPSVDNSLDGTKLRVISYNFHVQSRPTTIRTEGQSLRQ